MTDQIMVPGSRSLEEAKAGIRDHITAAAQNFIAIGYWLKCIRDGKLYEQDGYGTVWDLAEAEYGISKSTASRYMKMNDRFSAGGNSLEADEKYKEFGRSQLQEMLYLTEEQLEGVAPGDTVAKIRDMRQQEKEDDQIPGQQEIERDYPEWCPSSGGSVTISAEDFGIQAEEIAKEEKREPFTISLDDLMEPVATSQPEKIPCIHRPQFDCHLTAEQMLIPGDRKDCQGKCCWDCTNKENCTIECYSSAGRPEDNEVQEEECADQTKQVDREEGSSLVVDAEFEEIPQQEKDDQSDLEILKAMLEKEKKDLEEMKRVNEAEPDPTLEKIIRKKKLLVGAMAEMLCNLEQTGVEAPEEAEREQPELPKLRNNDQRKSWLDTYRDWPVWFRVPEAAEAYYRYDLPDGSSLVICEYRYWIEWLENPERIGTREYILTPGYHYFEDCKSNWTAMVEHLKGIQRKEKK